MEPVTSVLGGLVIALVAGVAGKAIGSNDNIKQSTCSERQHACQSLLIEKIDNVEEKLDNLTKAVNTKLYSI